LPLAGLACRALRRASERRTKPRTNADLLLGLLFVFKRELVFFCIVCIGLTLPS
jgi:hypothetical protein